MQWRTAPVVHIFLKLMNLLRAAQENGASGLPRDLALYLYSSGVNLSISNSRTSPVAYAIYFPYGKSC